MSQVQSRALTEDDFLGEPYKVTTKPKQQKTTRVTNPLFELNDLTPDEKRRRDRLREMSKQLNDISLPEEVIYSDPNASGVADPNAKQKAIEGHPYGALLQMPEEELSKKYSFENPNLFRDETLKEEELMGGLYMGRLARETVNEEDLIFTVDKDGKRGAQPIGRIPRDGDIERINYSEPRKIPFNIPGTPLTKGLDIPFTSVDVDPKRLSDINAGVGDYSNWDDVKSDPLGFAKMSNSLSNLVTSKDKYNVSEYYAPSNQVSEGTRDLSLYGPGMFQDLAGGIGLGIATGGAGYSPILAGLTSSIPMMVDESEAADKGSRSIPATVATVGANAIWGATGGAAGGQLFNKGLKSAGKIIGATATIDGATAMAQNMILQANREANAGKTDKNSLSDYINMESGLNAVVQGGGGALLNTLTGGGIGYATNKIKSYVTGNVEVNASRINNAFANGVEPDKLKVANNPITGEQTVVVDNAGVKAAEADAQPVVSNNNWTGRFVGQVDRYLTGEAKTSRDNVIKYTLDAKKVTPEHEKVFSYLGTRSTNANAPNHKNNAVEVIRSVNTVSGGREFPTGKEALQFAVDVLQGKIPAKLPGTDAITKPVLTLADELKKVQQTRNLIEETLDETKSRLRTLGISEEDAEAAVKDVLYDVTKANSYNEGISNLVRANNIKDLDLPSQIKSRVREKLDGKIKAALEITNPDAASQFEVAVPIKNTKKVKDDGTAPKKNSKVEVIGTDKDAVLTVQKVADAVAAGNLKGAAEIATKAGLVKPGEAEAYVNQIVNTKPTTVDEVTGQIVINADEIDTTKVDEVTAAIVDQVGLDEVKPRIVVRYRNDAIWDADPSFGVPVVHNEGEGWGNNMLTKAVLLTQLGDDDAQKAAIKSSIAEQLGYTEEFIDGMAANLKKDLDAGLPLDVTPYLTPPKAFVINGDPEALKRLVDAGTVTDTSSPGQDLVISQVITDQVDNAFNTTTDGSKIDAAISKIHQATLAPYESTTPIVRLSTGQTATIDINAQDLEVKALLNYNPQNLTAEEKQQVSDAFMAIYGYDMDSASKDVTDYILRKAEQEVKDAIATGTKYDNVILDENDLAFIDEYLGSIDRTPIKPKTGYDADVNITAENEVLYNTTLKNGMTLATLPLFAMPVDDSDDAETNWYMNMVKGIGFTGAAIMLGMQTGKFDMLKDRAKKAMSNNTYISTIRNNTTSVGDDLATSIGNSPYMRVFKQQRQDQIAEQKINLSQAQAEIKKETDKLINLAEQTLNVTPVGNVAQKAQKNSEWRKIYERMTSGRIEALTDIAPAANKFETWVKETPPDVQNLLISANIRFKRDWNDLKNAKTPMDQMIQFSQGFFENYVVPNLPQGTNAGMVRQQWQEFRNVMNALTQADMTISINNDLVWFQNNFTEYVPGMAVNERITLENLIAHETHYEDELFKIQDDINVIDEKIAAYKRDNTAQAKIQKDAEKNGDVVAANDAKNKISTNEKHILNEQKNKKLIDQSNKKKGFVLLLKEAKEAEKFYNESVWSNYIDPMGAQKYHSKGMPITQVLKVELIDDNGLPTKLLKDGSEYNRAFAPIKSVKRFNNKDQQNKYTKEYLTNKGATYDDINKEWNYIDPQGNRFKVRDIRFNSEDNKKNRATDSQRILDVVQGLTVASKTGIFEYSAPDVKNGISKLKNIIEEVKTTLQKQADNGDDDAIELLQETTMIEEFVAAATDDLSPSALSDNIEALFKKIVGGRGLKKHASNNFDGYDTNADGYAYTAKDHIDAISEKFAMVISQAETQAALGAASNVIGDLRAKGLMNNPTFEDIVTWRDQTLMESPNQDIFAKLWNGFGYLKGVSMIAARPSTAIKNFFANINQIMLNQYINDKPIFLPQLLYQYGKTLANSADRARISAGVKGTSTKDVKLDKSIEIHNLLMNGEDGVSRNQNAPLAVKNIADFKQKVLDRMVETGGYSESAMNELAITSGGQVAQGFDAIVNRANRLNKRADAIGRAVIINNSIDDFINDLTQAQTAAVKKVKSGNLYDMDEGELRSAIESAALYAHMNADATLGRFSPLYKSKFERKFLNWSAYSPGFMIYTGPAMVGLHNWWNFAGKLGKNIAAGDTKKIIGGLGVLTGAWLVGGYNSIPAVNDLIKLGNFLDFGESDQDEMTTDALTLDMFVKLENGLRTYLMDWGMDAHTADKFIMGAKRGGLSGFANRGMAQEESFFSVLSPVMLETGLRTYDKIDTDGIGGSALGQLIWGGIVKEATVGIHDVMRGYRTDKDNFSTGYEYDMIDFLNDLALGKPLTLSGGRQDKFLKKTALLGADNRRQFSKAFFQNSGIRFNGLSADAKGIKSDPLFEQAAPYLASKFTAHLADPDVQNAMENSNEMIENLFIETELLDEVAFFIGVDDLEGDARAQVVSKTRSELKTNATKNFMSELTGRTWEDYVKTDEGKQLLKRYNVVTPVKTTIMNQSMTANSLSGRYSHFDPYGNNNVDAMYDYGRIAVVNTLWNKFNNSSTPKTAENLDRFRKFATKVMSRKDL